MCCHVNQGFFACQQRYGWHHVCVYIETIPNRSPPPAILLREGYRENGKVVKRTLANLSHRDPQLVEHFRVLLKGGVGWSRRARF